MKYLFFFQAWHYRSVTEEKENTVFVVELFSVCGGVTRTRLYILMPYSSEKGKNIFMTFTTSHSVTCVADQFPLQEIVNLSLDYRPWVESFRSGKNFVEIPDQSPLDLTGFHECQMLKGINVACYLSFSHKSTCRHLRSCFVNPLLCIRVTTDTESYFIAWHFERVEKPQKLVLSNNI